MALGFIVIKAGTDGDEDILQGYTLKNNKMSPSFTKDQGNIGCAIALFQCKADAWQAVRDLKERQGIDCHVEQIISGHLQMTED